MVPSGSEAVAESAMDAGAVNTDPLSGLSNDTLGLTLISAWSWGSLKARL